MINITELAPMHRQFFKIFVAFKIAEKHAEALKASEQNLKLEAEKKRDMKTKDNFVDEDDMDEVFCLSRYYLKYIISSISITKYMLLI